MFSRFYTKLPEDFNEQLHQAKTLIAAVSGGSDSLALLYFLKDYLTKHSLPLSLIAVTIDHQLRNNSFQDALYVQKLCEQENITHKILSWQDEKPKTGLLAAARFARYQLLIKEMSSYKKPLLCTGHSLTDQVETYLMRKKRVIHDTRGLAAMPFLSYLNDHKTLYPFCRPFLNIERDCLKTILREQNKIWLNDPSNENTIFERIRIRKALCSNAMETAQKSILNANLTRQNETEQAWQLLKKLNLTFQNHCLSFCFDENLKSHSAFPFLLKLLSAIVGGVSYIGGKKVDFFFSNHFLKVALNLKANSVIKKTKNRTLIQLSYKKNCEKPYHLQIWRENRHIEPLKLNAKQTILWDNRFFITNKTKADLLITTASSQNLKTFLTTHPLEKNFDKASLSSNLAIHYKENIFFPFLQKQEEYTNYFMIDYNLAPFQWLISSYDLKLYQSLKNIFNLVL